jgi:branched-subunit amino acid transport protein
MTETIEASNGYIYFIIASIALGTYLIRFSFLGIIGGRKLPSWVLRLLRFTPVAVLPGIAAPMVLSNDIISSDPERVIAAIVTLAIGLFLRNALLAITAGLATFFIFGWILG